MNRKIHQTDLELIQGDITQADMEAIVNAANSSLTMGGGVAGAIRRKGGPSIQRECDEIGGTHVGGAVLTTGGRLRADYVIHAVGPRMGEGREDQKLGDATRNSLKLAEEKGIKSIAFPAISTGIFGFPLDICAKVMLSTTLDYLKDNSRLSRVVFYLYDQEALRIFKEELNSQLGE